METYDIDEQIRTLELEIAENSRKLFQAQGKLMLALHLKSICHIKIKKRRERVTSRPTGL
jgi:hypothetical protein